MSDEQRLSDQHCYDVLRLVKEEGSQMAASRASGLTRNQVQHAVRAATDRGITLDWNPAPPPEPKEVSLVQVRQLLKGGATLDQMSLKTGGSHGQILDEIDNLHASGLAISRHGDIFVVEKSQPVGNVPEQEIPTFQTDANNRIRFGVSTDKHLCSKYAREDVLESLYGWFNEEGIRHVLDAGNWIDGEARFNKHDLKVHGMEPQVQYLVERVPEYEGMTTYAIAGDDHEGWYAQREGVDIGRFAESVFRHNGREDWVNLGYMEAFIRIENQATGASSVGLVMHPGGGSAYALSYKPQKIVEGFAGGEKPAFLVIGHYHKIMFALTRNVWTIQAGCSQDQTPFMRKRGIEAHVGGMIVEFEQDPETGALTGCTPQIRQYFNKGYYNHRWTPHGTPNLPRREVNTP